MEKMLGKDINDLDVTFTFIENKSQENTYLVQNISQYFLSERVDMLLIKTDSMDIIKSISTDFDKLIDKEFFSHMVTKFGAPSSTFKAGDKLNTKSEVLDNGIQVVSEKSKTVNCKFEEKPMFIIWKNEDCRIHLILNYNTGKTFLTISNS